MVDERDDEVAGPARGKPAEGPAGTEEEAAAGSGGAVPAASGGEGRGPIGGIVGESLRKSFRQFIRERVAPEHTGKGPINLDLDVDFLRQHGKDLVSTVAQDVAKALFPEQLRMKVADEPAAEEAAEAAGQAAGDAASAEAAEGAAATSETEPGEGGEPAVSVNFDLLRFVKGLFAQVRAPAGGTEAGATAPAAGTESEAAPAAAPATPDETKGPEGG